MAVTCITVNPLTTDDAIWCRLTLAACHQLVQSALKIGSALAEMLRQREVCGCTTLGDSAWWLLQLSIESSGRAGPVDLLSAFLHKWV